MTEDAIIMYGTAWCGDCKRAKQFFGEHRVRYRDVDVDGDAAGLAYVQELNDGKNIIPVLVFGDSPSPNPATPSWPRSSGSRRRPATPSTT